MCRRDAGGACSHQGRPTGHEEYPPASFTGARNSFSDLPILQKDRLVRANQIRRRQRADAAGFEVLHWDIVVGKWS